MRINKIASFAAVILLITVLFSGIITVLPAALPVAAQSSNVLSFQSGSFVGSKNSDVYHYPSCYHVNAIKPENKITFSTVQEACSRGYRPCKDCNPPPCGTMPTAAPTATPTSQPQPVGSSPTPTSKPTATSKTAPTEVSPSASNVAQASATANGSSTPGFEALYALVALATIVLALRVTRRR
jgi:hypothetical protein